MQHTIRKNRRLIEKCRRARQAPRLSVIEVFGAPPPRVDDTNRVGTRMMNSDREAAAQLSGKKGREDTPERQKPRTQE